VGTKGQRFPLGRLVITTNCERTILESHSHEDYMKGIAEALRRHQEGDWGQLVPEDWQLNEESVNGEGRILSAYEDIFKVKIWVITEWDRSATTVLLPEDY
jgi:hypothetical protein